MNARERKDAAIRQIGKQMVDRLEQRWPKPVRKQGDRIIMLTKARNLAKWDSRKRPVYFGAANPYSREAREFILRAFEEASDEYPIEIWGHVLSVELLDLII